jgi:hypothetical protein
MQVVTPGFILRYVKKLGFFNCILNEKPYVVYPTLFIAQYLGKIKEILPKNSRRKGKLIRRIDVLD